MVGNDLGRYVQHRVTKIVILIAIRIVIPNNTGGLYALMAIIGGCSLPMLPVALELACEMTRNADGASAIVWFACVVFGIAWFVCRLTILM